jgi:hypothetical protein
MNTEAKTEVASSSRLILAMSVPLSAFALQ